jgi:hypothetical protein
MSNPQPGSMIHSTTLHYIWTHCGRMPRILVFMFQAWGRWIARILVFRTFAFNTLCTALMCHRGQYTAQLCSQMFTEVLGIMTSPLITSKSKERPFVLFHGQAIFSHSTAGHSSSRFASIVLSPSKNISHVRCDSSRIIIWQFILCSEDIFNYS